MTDKPRRTILVLAYSISPVRGSEYAVAWNYVTHMARGNDLIVLYGVAGDHMGDIEEIAALPADALGGRVTFVPVEGGRRARITNHLNRTDVLPYSFYIAYRYWHLAALNAARRIVAEREVDIVHYLGPIGFREPGYLWKLGLPYIWGPIGGIALRPLRAFAGLSTRDAMLTAVRNLVNTAQFRLSPRVRRGIRAADILLAATSENARAIRQVYGRLPVVVPENAVTHVDAPRLPSPPDAPLRLIWVGRVVTEKAITLLLNALARLDRPGRWTLDVVGTGQLLEHVRGEADALGIDADITWHGKVTRETAVGLFAQADVHVLSSLAEGNPTVIWEAMSTGVPTIAIDHCGMHDTLCADCGVLLPLADIDTIVSRFARAIGELIDDRPRVARLSEGAIACAHRASWASRTDFWEGIYDRAIAVHAGQEARL